MKLFDKIGRTFESLLTNKMNYTIQDCERIFFRIDEAPQIEKRGVCRDQYIEDKIRYILKDEEKLRFNISLSIIYSQEKQHSLTQISGAKLSALSLRGDSTGKVIVKNSKIDSLYIHNFSVSKECSIHNIRPFREDSRDKNIEIKESNLDGFWLNNLSFDNYSKISLYRNNFNRVSITSCQFPIIIEGFDKFMTVENIHYPDRKDENYYRTRYETFLQLKNVLE